MYIKSPEGDPNKVLIAYSLIYMLLGACRFRTEGTPQALHPRQVGPGHRYLAPDRVIDAFPCRAGLFAPASRAPKKSTSARYQ
jgi:hypothetical protein